MLVMAGASASGKTEIAKIIINKYGFQKMITYTTREKRLGEKDAVDYHFISFDEFLTCEKNSFFIETTFYNNNYYGTAFKDTSNNKVLIVDPNGANILHHRLKEKIVIFYLQTSLEIRKQRMILRGDQEQDIRFRLNEDDKYFQINNFDHIDYIINTDYLSLDDLAQEIHKIYMMHIQKI